MKAWIRVRYMGDTHRNLGVYGTVVPGEEFSISMRDWQYMEQSVDGIPDYLEKLGESDEREGRDQPVSALDREAKLAWANGHEGVEIAAEILEELAEKTDSEFLEIINVMVQAALNPDEPINYVEMTVDALLELCKEREIEGVGSKTRKPQLIQALMENDKQEASTEEGNGVAAVFKYVEDDEGETELDREATLLAVEETGITFEDESLAALSGMEDDEFVAAISEAIADKANEDKDPEE